MDRTYIQPGDRVCAAVSGGADSVAMLLLLRAANGLPKNALGVGLTAVHVHHGLRGEEADADLAFVEELCERLGIPLHVRHASVPERLERSRQNDRAETVEEAARAVRYEVFGELLADGAVDSVLTAHTLDDQAETVLMKFLRGAWTEGLSGVHPVVSLDGVNVPEDKAVMRSQAANRSSQGRVLRPLLGVRHAELCEFLIAQKQPWREDSSNSDEAFTRNRIRRQLMPMLREFNPAIDEALANLALLAREEEARWTSELSRVLPQLLLPGKPVRGGGRAVATSPGNSASVAIELDRLRPLDPALRRRVLRAAARSLGARLSFDETARLLELAGFDATSAARYDLAAKGRNSTLQIGGQLRAERSAREIRLSRATANES